MSKGLRPYCGYSRRAQREMLVDAYRSLGDLYGARYAEGEVGHIVDELEELGVPMGYGRVTKTPTVLGDEYGPVIYRDRLRLGQ
jgi:hypothetical protein